MKVDASARKRPRVRKPSPERREEIRRVAMELFRERGYPATGIVDIAERLGLSGAALYRHFRSKEEILRSAIEENLADATAETQRIAAEARSPREALNRLVEAGVRRVLNDPELAVTAVRDQVLLSPATRAFLGRAQRRVVEDWVGIVARLRPDLEANAVERVVLGVMGMLLWMAQFEADAPRDQAERRMRDMATGAILRGAAAGGRAVRGARRRERGR